MFLSYLLELDEFGWGLLDGDEEDGGHGLRTPQESRNLNVSSTEI